MKHIETKPPPRHRLPVVITTSEWESTPRGGEGDGVGLGVQLAPVGGHGRAAALRNRKDVSILAARHLCRKAQRTVWRIPWFPQTSPFDSRRFGN